MYKSYVPPTEFVADNDFFVIKMGATQHIDTNPVSTGLLCLVWAASQTLIRQHGQSEMTAVFHAIFPTAIGALADVFDDHGNAPIHQIKLAMVDVEFAVDNSDLDVMVVICCATYRTENPGGITAYFAIVAADEAALFMQEREAANLPTHRLH